MSFFIRKKGRDSDSTKAKIGSLSKGGKRRKTDSSGVSGDQSLKKRRAILGSEDEEIPSSSDSENEDIIEPTKADVPSSSEEDEETAQDKRIRLAKQYLAQIEAEETDRRDQDEDPTTAVADRLKQDILEQSGKLQRLVAKTYLPATDEDIRVCRGHNLPVTSVVITSDDKFIFSAAKDCAIVKWCVETGKKVKVIPGGRKGTEDKHVGHTSIVMCLAISTDNQYLASGDKNKLILLWNPENFDLLHKFTGHRDAISGLAFRKGTHQLFSASHDRTIKIWNVDERAYVESLFGHHDVITGIDSLTRERAITSGGRDGSIRVWKVIEESQLVFNGHSGSIDCVSLINEEHFVSGADNNSLALWSVMKKKPVAYLQNAHGSPEAKSSENWISSVVSLTHTDLVASGSSDGFIRLWQCENNFHSLKPLFSIPLNGFVNSLKFSSDGSFLVAGVGQEHRLGRWWRNKDAKNSVCIISLKRKPAEPGAKPAVMVMGNSHRRSSRRKGQKSSRS